MKLACSARYLQVFSSSCWQRRLRTRLRRSYLCACESIGLRLGRHGGDQVILADVNNDGIG